MKDYGPAKGGKKKRDPNASRDLSGFSYSALNSAPDQVYKPGISIGDVARAGRDVE